MMFGNLIHSFFGGCQGCSSKPSVTCQEDNPKTSEKKDKYSEDVKALTEKYGELTNLCIETELSELLRIAPRERHRTDAYRGLISYLKEKYNTVLNIKSQKTK